MNAPARRQVILEFPASFDYRSPAAVLRVFNAENGKQIITITDLHLDFNAEGLASVQARFLGGEEEELQLAGVRIQP